MDTKTDLPDIAGCLSDSLMHANEMQAVVVLSITKTGAIMTAWSASYAERLAVAKHFHRAMDYEMDAMIEEGESIDGEEEDKL
jgi:hypothetical protein